MTGLKFFSEFLHADRPSDAAFAADGIVFWGGFQQPWSDMATIYPIIKRFVADWHD